MTSRIIHDRDLLVPGRITHIFGPEAHVVALGVIVAERKKDVDTYVIQPAEGGIPFSSTPYEGTLCIEKDLEVEAQVRALRGALQRGYKLIVLDRPYRNEVAPELLGEDSAIWDFAVPRLAVRLQEVGASLLVLHPEGRIQRLWKFYASRRIEAGRFEGQLRLRFVKERMSVAQGCIYSSAGLEGSWLLQDFPALRSEDELKEHRRISDEMAKMFHDEESHPQTYVPNLE